MLVGGLLIAVAIIFFLMLVHFRHVATAMLLLVSLLMTLFGTGLGVLLTGVNFGLTCYLGIIALMGILIRNAIIMYDYAEELRASEGLSARKAIFLTSAAASMGVIPMILGGSGLWMPMGSVICFGTIATMLLILTVLPVAYWLIMSGTTNKRLAHQALEHQ